MKNIFSLAICLFVSYSLTAQKVDYKDQTISVDGKAIAKVKKQSNKENLGMISDYEISNPDGKLLIIGSYASEFPEDKNDNMSYYYKLSFVGLDKTGYFKVAKLGTEKSLAKLIGESGIIKDGALDNDALFAFIAKKGKTPPMQGADYSLVQRDKSWPLEFEEGNSIEQNSKQIGTWKDVTSSGSNVDYYEFYLPSGLKVASVNFQNGNNAQNCEVTTMKDGRKQLAAIPSQDKVIVSASSIDRNYETLKRIVKWLVANQYL